LIIILVIALIFFGPGKLPELGNTIGKAIRGFKKPWMSRKRSRMTRQTLKKSVIKKSKIHKIFYFGGEDHADSAGDVGCRYPVIQGPIAALNSPKMIAAICEAGAFGMLALGFSNPDEAKRLVGEVRALTAKPFGANLMIMNPANPKILEILAEAGVKTVTTSAVLQKAFIRKSTRWV